MKKLLALFMSAIMLFSLAGCGGGSSMKSVDEAKKIFEKHGITTTSAKDSPNSKKDIKEYGLKDGVASDGGEVNVMYAEFDSKANAEKYFKKIMDDTGVGDYVKDGEDGLGGTHKKVELGPANMNFMVKEQFVFFTMGMKSEQLVEIAKELGF